MVSLLHKYEKYFIPAIAFALIILFLFFRFYNLQNSFSFLGDLARDSEKLMEWYQGSKPPLIGPNTILKIVNQSPWYFYLNAPVFFLFRSPYTMTITLSLLSVLSFIYSLFILRSKKEMPYILVLFFLIATHPIIVMQQRNPWNPTFAIPFLLSAIAGFLYLKKTYQPVIAFITAFSLALALGMTYSTTPVVFVLIAAILYFLSGKKRLAWVLHLIVSFGLVFGPLFIFEIRSHFFTLSRLATGLNIPAVHATLLGKISFLITYVLTGLTTFDTMKWQIVAFFVLFLLNLIHADLDKKHNKDFLLFSFLLFIAIGVTLLMPFQQGYYLFGIMMLLFLTISSMKPYILILTIMLCAVMWITPTSLEQYFNPVKQPVNTMNSCAERFCKQHPGNYYVSTNNQLGIHSGHDQSFFLNRNGCVSRDIVSFPRLNYDTMVVVADFAKFMPHKTSYYELEQFGKYKITDVFKCTENIQYYLLKKQ